MDRENNRILSIDKPGSAARRGKRYRGRSILLLLLCMLLISGCGNGSTLTSGKSSERGYSLPEIMVIAMTEKNRYESVYSEQIWNVSIEGGESFEQYLTGEIRTFMEQLKIMNLLAEERNLSLSAQERSAMNEAAGIYFDSLTEADIEYMGVTREDVRTVYEDYCLAEKLVEELAVGINLEVSDNEAKVISFQQAIAADRQTAEQLIADASQERADFASCARALNLTVTERTLGRKEEAQVFEDAAFSLLNGQISGVIELDGAYYVLKCINDYDEEATAARKQIIFEERKKKAFQEQYDSFSETVTLSYTGEPWETLNLASGSYAAGADFFEIYREQMQ